MKYLLTVISLFTCAALSAQVNLVKNPSLEQHTFCPNAWEEIRAAVNWSPIDTVSNPPMCTPEYCNTCGTGLPSIPYGGYYYQYPRTGAGMAQLQIFYDERILPPPFNYYRDYLQGRLYQPLIAGKQYCVTFYTVLEETSDYAIGSIGAYLDNGSIDNTDSIGCAAPQTAHTPQIENTSLIYDTLNWTKIEGTFTATGVERFITIGNFKDKVHTVYTPYLGLSGGGYSYYLIDDVSVIASDAIAYAGHDTAIGFGDSVYIGMHDEAMPCTWTKQGSATVIHDGAGMWVKPTATTKYIVKQTLCGVISYDTVTITVWPQSVNNLTGSSFAKVFPNPASNVLHIDNLKETATYQIVNIIGVPVQQGALLPGNNDVFITNIPTGIYLLVLTNTNGVKTIIRLVKE